MLRDLVKEVHTEAENSPFAKLLMSGDISKKQYAHYLYQQEPMYHALEKRADELDLLKDIPNIKRGLKITADFHNLQIGEPIDVGKISKIITDLNQVGDLITLKQNLIVNKTERDSFYDFAFSVTRSYSNNVIDPNIYYSNGLLYPPKAGIFEMKYSSQDITIIAK